MTLDSFVADPPDGPGAGMDRAREALRRVFGHAEFLSWFEAASS